MAAVSEWSQQSPAFPGIEMPGGGYPGMFLRDYFAAKAMQGLIARYEDAGNTPMQEESARRCASFAYQFADAMISERSK